MILDDEKMTAAIDRISRTLDGQALYLFLQKTLSGVPPDPQGNALPVHHGRRTFAAELMALMAAGIRDTHGGRDPTDGPITFALREPVRLAGRESARDRIARTDPELNAGPGGSSAA